MCYANPLYARGLDTAVARIAASGIAGLIVPDLPAEESSDVRRQCDAAGLALVPLVAPTTPPEKIDEIAGNARGFVYVVSVTGVTGERGELPSGLEAVVARARAAASVPVAVGFGVGTPEMAGKVGAIADGVIIGSRLVRAIADAADVESGIADASDFLHACGRVLEV
jgi:tryptophan synthase alpha chain